MIEVLSNRWHIAAKQHTCDDCNGKIKPGERYHIQAVVYGGSFHTFKSHERCEYAANIVIHYMDWADYADGRPRIADLEEEDWQTIRDDDPDVFRMFVKRESGHGPPKAMEDDYSRAEGI